MKEKIYTIPVNEAFSSDCECPFCQLQNKLEQEQIEYTLGASLMEPDCRLITNDKGFCTKHYESLFASKLNSLGLGLILETHLAQQINDIKSLYIKKQSECEKEATESFWHKFAKKLQSKPSETEKLIKELISKLNNLHKKCTICDRLDYTMDRYLDVFFYLWLNEPEFRRLTYKNKGYCLTHMNYILNGMEKYLNRREAAVFLPEFMKNQLENLDRIQEDVSWFVKKFDYRFNDAPWKNSKDALQRTIQKLSGAKLS
jgi:hypothetical protein